MTHDNEKKIYGLMAEFATSEALVEASQKAYDAGYRNMDAFAPFPVHGLSEAVGFKKTRLPLFVLIGALVGMVTGFGMQYFAMVIHLPLNIGGRPHNSWPSFIPITFEVTILFAAFAAVIGMFVLNGLPQPYHPVFNVERFKRASQDRFFLCLESADTKFNPASTRAFLSGLRPIEVFEVEP